MRDWINPITVMWRALLGAALLALAGGAWAQRLSLDSLQRQINAKMALSDLAGCAANDTVVRVAGVWKCKSTLPRFVDNGNGTVTDNKTGLMWEQKVTCGAQDLANPRCKENLYTWSDASPFTEPTGTLYTSFLPALNDLNTPNDGNATPCFANYCDWRIPTIGELRSILLVQAPTFCASIPCIDEAMLPMQASPGSFYWSSSSVSVAGISAAAWGVFFVNSAIGQDLKFGPKYARAVRGGGL
jgi:hypothetical protein